MNVSLGASDASEQARWSRIFSGSDFYYGLEPGPVARRTVRYARPLSSPNPTALDVGCGEGQDLVFLARSGYEATGIDFTSTGLSKAKLLLESQRQTAHLYEADVSVWQPEKPFDVVIAVNCLQFLGERAPATLERIQSWVKPGGILGLSLFSRDAEATSALENGLYCPTLSELMEKFAGWRYFETAKLWQWNSEGKAQPFVTLIASRP